MKNLCEYIQDAQTKAFDDAGAFFAFSTHQFDEAKTEGVKYTSLGGGLICPAGKGLALMELLGEIVTAGIAQDIEGNGIDAIIQRELANHECYYTGDISDCVEKLKDYGTTQEKIMVIFNQERIKQVHTF